MSEPELAYMTGNDDFDLPRWQTQTSHEAGTTYYSPPPPPPSLTSHRIPQQSPGSSRQPRITQIVEEDNQFGVNPVPYNAGPLSRSNSMGGSTGSTRRRHHLPDELEGPGPNSLYPASVPFQSQTSSDAINSAPPSGSPYQEMYYNSSPTHPPKRSQTQHDSSTSSRSGRSPMRHGNLSTPSLLDTYATQQSQYSPTTGPGFNYPDQQRPYGSSAYKSHSRNNSNTNPVAGSDNPPPYPPQYGGSSQSPNPPPASSPGHLTSQRSVRQNSSSVPSTPLSFAQGNQPGEGATHYYPQEAQPMVVETSKRRAVGFHRVRDHNDLRPVINRIPTGRRMDSQGLYLAPIRQLTTHIVDTFRICNPQFRYESTHNPRRVLTKPSKPAHNDGYDNEDYDYILYVNDWLGTDDGHNRYLILDILGQGTFGQVVKCQNMKTHEIVAVKVVKNKPAYFNQSMMEVTILELLNNQCDPNDEHHILRLRDSFIHRSHLCLVFELLSSNLYELIKQNQFQGLSTQLVKVFTAQLLDSMTVLKEARLIHCDLKPENILLKSLQSPQIKVIDFGSACHERQTVYTYIQSRFYRSPEVLLGIPYNASIDMWSLGCIAVELFLGLPLFPGTSEYNQITRIVEMLGMPQQYMMDMGKQTSHFFDSHVDVYGHKKYRLKSIEQYSRERNANEQPGKQYFKATTLPDIINQAPMPNFKSTRHGTEMEKELNNRASFIDFCQGLLNLNPLERWTPQQARQHPFITGEKYTKPWSPSSQANTPQPQQPRSSPPTDPKRPYGGLVPSQPKGTRAYQDAASYNQHLAQHQAYTAQAQAASQASSLYRNPYITPQTSQSGVSAAPSSYNPQDKSGAGFNPALNANSSPQQYPSNNPGFPVPPPQLNPNPPANTYYPNTSGARGRATTINQMDNVPPALARLQHMNQDVIGGRNALTPVLKRDDGIREWERRQTGKAAAAQPYPQLEYLHQQAELAAAQGLTNWGGQNRYAGPGTAPQQSSNLSHSYHIPPTTAAMVVDDDRRDVVMSSVRSAAQVEGASTVFGTASNAVTSPTQAYASNATTTGNRYPTFPQQQSQQQSQQNSAFDSIDRRTDIGNMYVPMQPDQFSTYNAAPTSGGTQSGSLSGSRLPGIQPGQTLPPSFYGGAVVAAGVGGGGSTGQPRGLFDTTAPQGNAKDARRGSNQESWPR